MNLSAAYMKRQQEWLEEGEQRGIEQGIDRTRREVAIEALREGYPPDAIKKLTRLSLEEIEKLRESLG
jgi:predicted transposase/invertase (TIGR01784 family)